MSFLAISGAYFLHPLSVFQFISLAFGNPRPIYGIEVIVTSLWMPQNVLEYRTTMTT